MEALGGGRRHMQGQLCRMRVDFFPLISTIWPFNPFPTIHASQSDSFYYSGALNELPKLGEGMLSGISFYYSSFKLSVLA